MTLLVGLLVGVGIAAIWNTEFGLAGLYFTFVLLAFTNAIPCLGQLLKTPVLIWFGQRSYGLYLFHEAVSGWCYGLLRHSAPEMRTMADGGVALLAFGVTLLLSTWSYRFFESPILRFGHGFRYRSTIQKKPSLQATPEGV